MGVPELFGPVLLREARDTDSDILTCTAMIDVAGLLCCMWAM